MYYITGIQISLGDAHLQYSTISLPNWLKHLAYANVP